MNIEHLRDYCLAKPGVTEGFPFGEDTLVFKVGGKMFLLIEVGEATSFNVKCDPELAIELRERHTEVKPGYHMNKKLWNTVDLHGGLNDKQLLAMMDHSYGLVFAALPKKTQAEINIL